MINLNRTFGVVRLNCFRQLERAACGIARLVALISFTGLAILIPSEAKSVTTHTFTPREYIRSILDYEQALCLTKLYGKESAFRVDAIGNLSSPTKSYVYGIPQLKNPLIKDMSAYNQINYGLKYIDHRYDGDTCKAWDHWLRRGWH